MPRPNITIQDITVPATPTPVQGFNQPCGTSYDTLITVKQPYKGSGARTFDLAVRGNLIESPPDLADLAAAVETIVQAQKLLNGTNSQLPVLLVTDLNQAAPAGVLKIADPASRAALQNMLDKATSYATAAGALWGYWADEYQPTVVSEVLPPASGPPRGVATIQSQMPHWPLSVPAAGLVMPYCVNGTPGTAVQVDTATWRAMVACPSTPTAEIHQADRSLFVQLCLAAMLWARCAEETIAVVGLHYLNRADHEAEIGGIVLGPPEPPAPVPPIADPGPQPPPPKPPGDIAPQPEPEPEVTPEPPPETPGFDPTPQPGGFDPIPDPTPQPTPTPAMPSVQPTWLEQYGVKLAAALAVVTVAYVGYQAVQRGQ